MKDVCKFLAGRCLCSTQPISLDSSSPTESCLEKRWVFPCGCDTIIIQISWLVVTSVKELSLCWALWCWAVCRLLCWGGARELLLSQHRVLALTALADVLWTIRHIVRALIISLSYLPGQLVSGLWGRNKRAGLGRTPEIWEKKSIRQC